jgi:succinate dehydrogenase/fumarate reductase flavoprotein subunit
MKLWGAEVDNLPDEHDVIVVGSGAAGLMAAAVAADAGLSVAVFEKSEQFGGTSAVSAGTLWVPCNPYMESVGRVDSPEQARQYLAATTGGTTPAQNLDRLIDSGAAMLEFAKTCGLTLDVASYFPDYRQDMPGAMPGARSLQPRLFDSSVLGDLRPVLRFDTNQLPYTMAEFKAWGSWENFPWDELQERMARGIVGRGAAIVAPLLAYCVANNVRLATEAPVSALLRDGSRIEGVEVDGRRFTARAGVVLACGGFEWNEEMVGKYVAAPISAKCSPPHNTGDGHLMAAAVGADFANMSEAWWAPMALVPGQQIDGEQVGRHLRTERQYPGSIIVDRNGKRFINESQDYNSLIRAANRAEAETGSSLPMYVVFDQRFLEKYGFITHRAGKPTPDWLTCEATLPDLARALSIDPAILEATVARFNELAIKGVDDDLDRGGNAYDNYGGDEANPYPNPNLAPLESGPFYAMQVMAGAFGTSGGVRTDDLGRALDAGGDVIGGLYAVGNVSSQPCAAGYPGAGATLGPGMTMGFVAGLSLAGRAVETSPAG